MATGRGGRNGGRGNARAWAATLALLAFVPVAAMSAPFAVGAPVTLLSPPLPAWATYDTGRVSVVFPAAIPQVVLYQDANSSVNAVLQVDGIFELTPGNLPHPTVVAAAFPTQASSFNATTPQNLTADPFLLSADLEVRTTNVGLWSSTGGIVPAGGWNVGPATLDIGYSATAPGALGSGVLVNWSIVGWPWMQPHDLLAIELRFAAENSATFTGCTASQELGSSSTHCAGAAFPAEGIVWDSTLTSIETEGADGPQASVAWTPTAMSANGSETLYAVGAFATGNGSAEVVLGAAAGATSSISGSITFSLVAPLPPAAPVILRGAVVPFVATVLIAGGGAAVGILAYRRRESRLREEL
jgi:hypothetical protein